MKYLLWILIFAAGFLSRGLFLSDPEDLQLENTSVQSVGSVDSILIQTITEQDLVTADLRKQISDLSLKLLAANKLKSNGSVPVIEKTQQGPNLEPTAIVMEESLIDTITIKEMNKVPQFVSIKTFYPDDYITSKVMAYGPAPADSLGNKINVDYNGYYQDRIRPKLKNNQWVLKDLALASGFGFLLGYLACDILK